jgi:thiamine-phosphate pyrophosphorylase
MTTAGGQVALHLRGHTLGAGELFRLAESLVPVAAETGTFLMINDRIDLALTGGFAGVQLGRRSLPLDIARRLLGADRWLGYSAHSIAEVNWAGSAGGDYLLLGTIYASATHPGEEPAGPEFLREAARNSTLPLIAIGGMSPSRVAEVRAAGAYGVAVLGAVWHADRPEAAVAAFHKELEE